MHNKRKTHSELQEEVNNEYTSLRLYERGLAEIKNETASGNLAKHLLKTTGSKIVDDVLLYVAEENMLKVIKLLGTNSFFDNFLVLALWNIILDG